MLAISRVVAAKYKRARWTRLTFAAADDEAQLCTHTHTGYLTVVACQDGARGGELS